MKKLIALLVSCLIYTFTCSQDRQKLLTPTEEGSFIGNSRVGLWEYRDRPSKVALAVDYSKGEIVYIEPDTTLFTVKEDPGWINTKLDIPCRFHGSLTTLLNHYQGTLTEFAAEIFKSNSQLDVLLEFEVNTEGVAMNPQISDDVPKQIKIAVLKKFNEAPNYWIVGIKNNEAKICKMAIRFMLCSTDCVDKRGALPTKVLLNFKLVQNGLHSSKQNTYNRFFNIINESNGILFSPDDKKLVIELGAIQPLSNESQVLCIINLENYQSTVVPFPGCKGVTWIGNDRLLFKYQFPPWQGLAAIYDYTKNEIVQRSDSTTYFHTAAKSGNKVAFSNTYNNMFAVWNLSFVNNHVNLIETDPENAIIPISWSSDEKMILMQWQQNNFTKYFIYDLVSKQRKLIPLFDASFVGWHSDGFSTIFQKVKTSDFSISSTLYQYNPTTEKLAEFYPSTKYMNRALISPFDNKIAYTGNGKLYLITPGSTEKPKVLAEKTTSNFVWSNNGELIAFVSGKDNQIYIYSLSKGEIQKISNW